MNVTSFDTSMGENNPQYQSALHVWKEKDPDTAEEFDQNATKRRM
jgi:hypothetical protein